jgi:hypothetical protein
LLNKLLIKILKVHVIPISQSFSEKLGGIDRQIIPPPYPPNFPIVEEGLGDLAFLGVEAIVYLGIFVVVIGLIAYVLSSPGGYYYMGNSFGGGGLGYNNRYGGGGFRPHLHMHGGHAHLHGKKLSKRVKRQIIGVSEK